MRILENEPLAPYTTFGIGGNARYFCKVTSREEAKKAFDYANRLDLPVHIVGKGSNTLFDDRGFNGLVILNAISYRKECAGGIDVGSGANFASLGQYTARGGFSGLEFACGIPATVGGAVYMNAGAGGKEVKDVLLEATFLHRNGIIELFKRDEIAFSYRRSAFHNMDGMILSAKFALTPCDQAKESSRQLLDYRLKTQPYGAKSAGCCFRNPEGASAGALIEQCGLKGTSEGGAEVSMIHGNFIVNRNGATAEEVKRLLDRLRLEVKEKTGYDLESEVRCIPYEFPR